MTGGASLIEAFDHVWNRLTVRLHGLTDEEYFWEPVTDCWSLRPRADGCWVLDGGGGGGPAPDPAPVTTIAWRLGHLAGMAVGGFADRLFGPGTLRPDDIDYPRRAADVGGFLAAQYAPWRAGLLSLDDAGWAASLGDRWGPYATASRFDLALHVFDEVVHHAAEIGVLRDLYAAAFTRSTQR